MAQKVLYLQYVLMRIRYMDIRKTRYAKSNCKSSHTYLVWLADGKENDFFKQGSDI